MLCQESVGISTGVVASFLAFYSAYDKSTKQLNLKLLQRVLSFENARFSFLQLNKVTGLSALTIAGLGLYPNKYTDGCAGNLMAIAAMMGAFHSGSSSYLFYGYNPVKMIKGEGKGVKFEVPALAFGLAGLSMFAWEVKNGEVRSPASYVALLMAQLHFYFIETPTGLPQDLPCRPYAYISVATAVAAFNAFGWNRLFTTIAGGICKAVHGKLLA